MVSDREDGAERAAELRSLLEGQREAGSIVARALLARPGQLGDGMWLIEPVGTQSPATVPASETSTSTEGTAAQPVG